MKHETIWSKIKIAACAAACAVATEGALATPPGVYSGVIDFSQTGSATIVGTVATNNASFPLPTGGQGLGIMLTANEAGGTGSNLVVTFQTTDGSGVWTTTNNMNCPMTLINATNVTAFFYFSSTNFQGMTSARTQFFNTLPTNVITLSGRWCVFPQ